DVESEAKIATSTHPAGRYKLLSQLTSHKARSVGDR
ncbi:MAG: hypothetical protein ACJA13_003556, partial [Paraglaciecola sp.]